MTYNKLMGRLSKPDLKFVLDFLDENRKFLTNEQVIKEVFKESCGKITLDFEELDLILSEFELPKSRNKHYRESIQHLKRYIKNNEKYRRQFWEKNQE